MQTYTWRQKRTVLDEFWAMRSRRVLAGKISWELKYPGRKFQLVNEYLRELGQVQESEEAVPSPAGEEDRTMVQTPDHRS